MKDFLILNFQAPLLSFGGPIIDQYGFNQEFPALSMLTGLLGNALGYCHADHEKLQLLQKNLLFAVRCDREGTKIKDFQTVDLGQEFLIDTGWTTFGYVQKRDGGDAKTGIHLRFRQYWADAEFTIAVTLNNEDFISIKDLAEALEQPKRPLFVGRKNCLPSNRIFQKIIEAEDAFSALQQISIEETKSYKIWIFDDNPEKLSECIAINPITDKKDWKNQIHCGMRFSGLKMINLSAEGE